MDIVIYSSYLYDKYHSLLGFKGPPVDSLIWWHFNTETRPPEYYISYRQIQICQQIINLCNYTLNG